MKGVIVVAGGECNSGAPFNTVEGYDIKAGRWMTLAPMPVGKHGITAATDCQVMYIGAGNPECGMSLSDRLVTFTLP